MYTGLPSFEDVSLLQWTRANCTYLVGFVVILRVVLENFLFLLIIERPDEVVYLEVFPPFLAIYKPAPISAMIQ